MTTTQTQKLVLHNNEEINEIAWEMIGISAKVTDTPIGMFGSGLCFAIAGILRIGGKIQIHAGNKVFIFGTKTMTFRGQTFDRVTCNDKELQFSTDMGKHWEPWQYYRELVSNTMDEGGIWYLGEAQAEGTSVVVDCPEILEAAKNHEKYFIGERKPLAETPYVRIYKGEGNIFYRGVRIGYVQRASFDYEMIKETFITEDRTLQSEYSVKSDIGYAFACQLDDEKLLKQLVMCETGFEAEVDWDWTWSDALKKVITEVWTNSPTKLNSGLIRLKATRMPGERITEEVMTNEQEQMLQNAKEFLAAAGYEVSAPVQLIRNTDDNNIAFVYKEKIYLTERSFEKGLFYLVTVLFEERSHVIGHDDCTRSFQTYLINQVITNARKHLKVVL